jgi:hypothetical protein
MQLRLASFTLHPPAFSKWLVNEQRHPHVAGNTACCSSDDHTKGTKWGEAIIDSFVEQREREEPATRPWSVLSVAEKGSTPVSDNDMEFTWRTKANEMAEARAQRGSGRIVGLQDASRSRLIGMHWALRRQSSPGGSTAQQLQRTT